MTFTSKAEGAQMGLRITCRWFALCTNEATTTHPHPIIGDVPVCDRCLSKIKGDTKVMPQSKAARAAMLIKWLTDDAEWHTADLHREVVGLLGDIFSPEAIAAGHLENAARMTTALPNESAAVVTAMRRTIDPAAVAAALSGDAILTESPHDTYPVQVIRTGGRQGGKTADMEARIAAALETGGDGCVVVYGASTNGAICRRHGGRWPHKDGDA